MDVDAFMYFLEPRPNSERWDLIDGIPVFMDPVTALHRCIAYNLACLLDDAFNARRLDLHVSVNVCVRNPGVKDFQAQPDVSASPGVAGFKVYLECYRLVAEVLSPTNMGVELDLKLRRYLEAPDNLYALVIDPYQIRVEMHAKRRGWDRVVVASPDDAIDMPEFGVRFRMAELYRGTVLDPEWVD